MHLFKNKIISLHNYKIVTTSKKFNAASILSNITSMTKFLQLSQKYSLQLFFPYPGSSQVSLSTNVTCHFLLISFNLNHYSSFHYTDIF